MVRPAVNENFSRRGTTLVELLVVSTVMVFLLGIVAVVTHTLSKAQRSTRAEIESRRSLARLATQFRADGHATKICQRWDTGSESGPELILKRADGQQIHYRVLRQPARVERTVLQAEADAVAGRDTYRLPRGATVRFKPFGEAFPPVLALVVSWPVGERPDPVERTLRIETAIGLHNRLSGGPARAGEGDE